MSQEQFSIAWNDFQSNVKSGFRDLLSRGSFADVTLAAEGKTLRAHRLVLSLCSPYFRNLFQTNQSQHTVVFLKDVSFSSLRDLLQFVYRGEVQVKREDLAAFISVAEQLQIKGLTESQGEPTPPSKSAPPALAKPIEIRKPPGVGEAFRPKRPVPIEKLDRGGPATVPPETVFKKRKVYREDKIFRNPKNEVLIDIEDGDDFPETLKFNAALRGPLAPPEENRPEDEEDETGKLKIINVSGELTIDDTEAGIEYIPENTQVSFVPSRSGGRLLVVDGFTYRQNVCSKNKVWWKCSSYCNTRCSSAAVTAGDDLLRHRPVHNHEAPPYQPW